MGARYLLDSFGSSTMLIRAADLVSFFRELDPVDSDRLISVTGMVTRTSTIIPEMRCAARGGG